MAATVRISKVMGRGVRGVRGVRGKMYSWNRR